MVKPKNSGKWSKEETSRLIKAMEYTTRWDDASEYVGTRTPDQCRSHNQKLKLQYKKLGSSYYHAFKPPKFDKSTQYMITDFAQNNVKGINQFNDYNLPYSKSKLLDTKKDTIKFDFISEDFIVGSNESDYSYTC